MTERCPKGKRISISRIIWSQMQTHFDKVKQAKLDGKNLQLQLMGAKHLTLEKFAANGIWYTGVHDLSLMGTIIPMSGLNFDEKEWDKLMELVGDINSDLAQETVKVHGVKQDVNGKDVTHDVLMYRWVWNVGKKRNVSDICFFSEEDCKADGTASKLASEKATFSFETVWSPPHK